MAWCGRSGGEVVGNILIQGIAVMNAIVAVLDIVSTTLIMMRR